MWNYSFSITAPSPDLLHHVAIAAISPENDGELFYCWRQQKHWNIEGDGSLFSSSI